MIARLGNSGNSTEPHLHFHVIDRDSVLAGEGLPYVHHSFTWLGTCERGAKDDEEKKRTCAMGEGEARYGEHPIRDHVVSFPE